jgi:hypothetical protein
MGRLARAVAKMLSGAEGLRSWTPHVFGSALPIDLPPPVDVRDDDPDTAMTRKRRDLAFELYAEALVQMQEEDEARVARERRRSGLVRRYRDSA